MPLQQEGNTRSEVRSSSLPARRPPQMILGLDRLDNTETFVRQGADMISWLDSLYAPLAPSRRGGGDASKSNEHSGEAKDSDPK